MQQPELIGTPFRKEEENNSSLQLFFRLHNGNGCRVSTHSSDVIKTILNSPALRQMELPNHMRLTFQGKQLTNQNLSLSQLGVKDHSIIHIQPVNEDSIKQLTLDLGIYYQKQRLYVRVRIDQTLLELKRKLFHVTHVAVSNQRLFFRGQQLLNDRTVDSYDINSDSLLCLLNSHKTDDTKIQTEIQQFHSLKKLPSNYSYIQTNQFQGLKCHRSYSNTIDIKSLGFEVKINTKSSINSDEEEQSLSPTQRDFHFGVFQIKEHSDESSKKELHSTQSRDSKKLKPPNKLQKKPERQINIDNLSNSTRQMIL